MLDPVSTKVAIACQGGGSQTAFTAGVLSRILRDPGLDRDFELVALSGTSGGAICSASACWPGPTVPAVGVTSPPICSARSGSGIQPTTRGT